MAVEVPVGCGNEDLRLHAVFEIEGNGEGARPPGEGDGAAARIVDGEIVAAGGKRYGADEAAPLVEDHHREAAVGLPRRREDQRVGRRKRGGGAGRERFGKARAGSGEKHAAVDDHRLNPRRAS